MKRRGAAAARAAAACVMAVAPLTGCGVRGSDVIEAGGPATVTVFPADEQRLLLFFVSPEGRLTPVARRVGGDGSGQAVRSGQAVGPPLGDKVLAALFAGPSDGERAAGLRTRLPRPEGRPAMKWSPRDVLVHLPLAVRDLSETARRQVVCTVAYAEGGDGDAEVTLAGQDGALPPTHCDA
ncbi:hypothetical protein [Streptomyces sparsogenes]|uniref:Lipoprotein n=1 Tax=Streptomyces sparsogenes DSM 40356 TaxID=1331668 RepID=A0A1R1SSP7_9ACTN|nr:hypothetical protein [Streptomyces sparsogenes]OMI41059.1 hypothetical protein SPAR_02771 [Streptomyces sparsogenes DSM 40356]